MLGSYGKASYSRRLHQVGKQISEVRVIIFSSCVLLIQREDAEQRITPWQEDASVSKCPICTFVSSYFSLIRYSNPDFQSLISPANKSKTPLSFMRPNNMCSTPETTYTACTLFAPFRCRCSATHRRSWRRRTLWSQSEDRSCWGRQILERCKNLQGVSPYFIVSVI